MTSKKVQKRNVLALVWLASILVALALASKLGAFKPRLTSAHPHAQMTHQSRQAQLEQDELIRLIREISRDLRGIRQCLCEHE